MCAKGDGRPLESSIFVGFVACTRYSDTKAVECEMLRFQDVLLEDQLLAG